jgi:hypothetical protein
MPSQERALDRVRVSVHDAVLGMTCLDCEAVEIVRGDTSQFNDEVRRFMRTHPGACAPAEPAERRLSAVPPVDPG